MARSDMSDLEWEFIKAVLPNKTRGKKRVDGLVPKQNSSGGKDRLGHISKMGSAYLRRLLVVGATSVTRRAPTTDCRTGAWVQSLLERKPTRLVTVAIANKTARTARTLFAKGETYKTTPAS